MGSHLVHRVRFELRAHRRATAVRGQEEAARFLRDRLPALLEAFLDARGPSDAHLRLDRLELDVGAVPLAGFEAALARSLPRALDRAFQQAGVAPGLPSTAKPRAVQKSATAGRPLRQPEANKVPDLVEAFVVYLRTGGLPWWCPRERWRAEVVEVLAKTDILRRYANWLREALDEEPRRAFRLPAFPGVVEAWFETLREAAARPELWRRFMDGLAGARRIRWQTALIVTAAVSSAPRGAGLATAVVEDLLAGPSWEEELAWVRAFRAREALDAVSTTSPDRPWFELLNRVESGEADRTSAAPVPPTVSRPDKTEARERRPPSTPTPVSESPREEGLETQSAGLVLLHPLLPHFFRQFDWLDGRNRLRSECGWSAVEALHELAHGVAAADETELALEKWLCGIPPDEPGLLTGPSARVREEGEEFLQAVIGHWSALKNTSPEGLREAFLARPGWLYRGGPDRSALLRVEPRGYDVLLGRLPWSFNPVRLPWLPEPLAVDWPSP